MEGMDTRFFPVWFEDVDFCARLRESGAKIMYCPAARFQHAGAHSVGQLEFGDRHQFWYGNLLRYARKHFAAWKVFVLRFGIVVGMGLRTLAACVGGGPNGIPWTTAVRGYWRVAMLAMGLSERRQRAAPKEIYRLLRTSSNSCSYFKATASQR
jgi:GT2 family glycosyltransferase